MKRKQTKAKARGQFSDKTKAQLYAWDNAVCAMTGASLWMLDYGASSLCHYDWADHVRPRSRGGSHEPANGVSVAENSNYEKGANGRANSFMYVAGQPTWKAFANLGKVPEDTAKFLRREVLPRDWYFNRCLANLMWFVFGKVEGWVGTRIKEKPMYYPKAALRFLEDFRAQWQEDFDVEVGPTFRQACLDWDNRGLMPASLGTDQELMMEVLTTTDADDLARIGRKLAPCLRINDRWIDRFDRWVASCEAAAGSQLLEELKRETRVTPHVRAVIEHNVKVLSGSKLRPRDGGKRVRSLARRAPDWCEQFGRPMGSSIVGQCECDRRQSTRSIGLIPGRKLCSSWTGTNGRDCIRCTCIRSSSSGCGRLWRSDWLGSRVNRRNMRWRSGSGCSGIGSDDHGSC